MTHITVTSWDGANCRPGPEQEIALDLIDRIESKTLWGRAGEEVEGFVVRFKAGGRAFCCGTPPELGVRSPVTSVDREELAELADREMTQADEDWLAERAASQATPPPLHTQDSGTQDSSAPLP